MANTTNWTILPIVINARGNKSAQILCNNAPVKIKFGPTTAPFGAGLFTKDDAATRLNLDLQCDETYCEFLNAVDDWAICLLADRSTEFFKKTMSKEEVVIIFKPSATPHCKNGIEYAPTWRTKINVSGLRPVRCWRPDKTAEQG